MAITTLAMCLEAKAFQVLPRPKDLVRSTRTSFVPTNWLLPSSLFNPRNSVICTTATTVISSKKVSNLRTLRCSVSPRKPNVSATSFSEADEKGRSFRKVLQIMLWVAEGVYILWLFLLPYAPGDPVWAISSETINSLIGLSLNFFFILPLMNNVGIHALDAAVLHPMAEGLFNFVVGWTFMFAPLLFTDRKRSSYKGSLDILWGLQMFLTNTFLIPYMAIRLNDVEEGNTWSQRSQLGSVMVKGASVVGVIGGFVCFVSALWGIFGRGTNFGSIPERWDFLLSYLGSERLGYAFIWDIGLYMIFQPWLIGDNLQNVQESKVNLVKYLRFIPVAGLVAYLLLLDLRDEEE